MRAPCFLGPRDFFSRPRAGQGRITTALSERSIKVSAEADDAQRGFAHGRTLLGAIDAFLGALAHTRPWLVDAREAELEPMARAWLDQGGANWLPGLSRAWVAEHAAALPPRRRAARLEALADLMDWAAAQGLLEPAL